MKQISFYLLLTALTFTATANALMSQAINPPLSVYDFTMKSLAGEDVSLSTYKGKVILIVNTASQCGYTPQYEGLQALYEKYKDQGFVILGFPADNFGGQEPGTDEEIGAFCTKNYGVTFPMFSKISVKGDDTHPLYLFLTQKDQNGALDAEMKWNFNKFLVNKEGKVVSFMLSKVKPDSDEMVGAIEGEL